MPRAGVRSVGCDVAHVGRTETREDRFRPFLPPVEYVNRKREARSSAGIGPPPEIRVTHGFRKNEGKVRIDAARHDRRYADVVIPVVEHHRLPHSIQAELGGVAGGAPGERIALGETAELHDEAAVFRQPSSSRLHQRRVQKIAIELAVKVQTWGGKRNRARISS